MKRQVLYKTKECDICMQVDTTTYETLDLRNVNIEIKASGDLPHHVVEGICEVLKHFTPDNPHLKENRCQK